MSDCEHGIDAAYYEHTPTGLEPVLECLCRWLCRGLSWEEAGREMDKHLEEATHDTH